MERYAVTIVGETPLLMHQDNIAFGDLMKKWQTDPANKAKSVAGDDRSPAFTWLGYLYHDSGLVAIPSDNLMVTLREGGAKVPTGKKGATFKRATQSGLLVDQAAWPVTVDGSTIDAKALLALMTEPDFAVHYEAAQAAGFELSVKRARVGQVKHIRVRPRFDKWSASGTITVLDNAITQGILETILAYAGVSCGLGDWRPSSPRSPGSWGKFAATVSKVR